MQAWAIDDPGDDRLDDYRELPDPAARRRRERDELFVAEGATAVERLLATDHRVRSVLVTPARLTGLRAVLDRAAVPVYVAAPDVLNAVVGFDLHRGVIAAADRRPAPTIDKVLAGARSVAVLEGLNDPENLGAIARSARALGIDGAVIDPTCIDPYYRRTVRVSMGEILHLPVARATSWPGDLDRLRDHGFELWALSPDPAGASLWDLPVPARVAVALGAEGPGLSSTVLGRADRRVRIPIRAEVDSLNVGHAAAVAFAALHRPGARPATPG